MANRLIEKFRLQVNVLAVSILFIVFTALGLTIDVPKSLSILKELKEFSNVLADMPPPILVLLIFLNNFVKSLLLIPLGAVLGIPPVVFVAFNGLLLGIVVRYSLISVGLLATLAAILPHGILEIPSILIASALALNVGWEAWIRMFGKDGHVKSAVKYSFKMCLKVILPMLALAAVIEVYITPMVYRLGV